MPTPRVIESPTVGSVTQDTAIVSLTITRMAKVGYVPSILMLTWDFAMNRGTWLISFEWLPSVINGSTTSSTGAELHLEEVSFVGENIVEILMTITYTSHLPS